MDSNFMLHSFIYAVMLPLVLISLCVILPPFFIFKFFVRIYRQISSENMQGKVVLITGASSGIGEQLAYEYAKKGAFLVIVARREIQLQKVAEKARRLGSPDVLPVIADVSNVDDCKRFVDEAVDRFGRLNHLVNNAGISCICGIEDVTTITNFASIMDINFWGSIYPTFFAIPHLKKTRGKIVINSSVSAVMQPPTVSFYSASKAALISFYESLRSELAPAITITIVTPGFVDSEMTRGKLLSKEGLIQMDTELSDIVVKAMPVMSARACGKAIVDAVCRGERNVIVPKWYQVFFIFKSLCPELMEWFYRNYFFKRIAPGSNVHSNIGSVFHSPNREE